MKSINRNCSLVKDLMLGTSMTLNRHGVRIENWGTMGLVTYCHPAVFFKKSCQEKLEEVLLYGGTYQKECYFRFGAFSRIAVIRVEAVAFIWWRAIYLEFYPNEKFEQVSGHFTLAA